MRAKMRNPRKDIGAPHSLRLSRSLAWSEVQYVREESVTILTSQTHICAGRLGRGLGLAALRREKRWSKSLAISYRDPSFCSHFATQSSYPQRWLSSWCLWACGVVPLGLCGWYSFSRLRLPCSRSPP